MRFRTTLLEGALLVNRELEGGKEFVVSIAEAGQGVKAEVRQDGVVQTSAQVIPQLGEIIVDGEWQQVRKLLHLASLKSLLTLNIFLVIQYSSDERTLSILQYCFDTAYNLIPV